MKEQKLIIHAINVPLETAVSVLNDVNIEKLESEQIDDDGVIVSEGAYMVYMETKRRKSVRVDVWRCARREE